MTSEENSSTPGAGASVTSPLIMEGDILESKVETTSGSVKGQKISAVWEFFDEITLLMVRLRLDASIVKLFTVSILVLLLLIIRGILINARRDQERRRVESNNCFHLPLLKMTTLKLHSTYKYDPEKLKEWCAKLVIVNEKPFSMLESKVFMGFCKFLNPRCEKVFRLTVKRECMKMYAIEKTNLKALLTSVSRISLASDMWTTSNQRKGYTSLTAHFVDADWKLQKKIINFRYVPPHTGVVMSECIYDCLVEWGIEKKISSITLDDASSNDTLVSFLRSRFKAAGNLFFEGKIFQVRCCAHILNLIVQEGLKAIDSTIANIRDSVKYIRGSPSRLSTWNDIIQCLDLKSKKQLKLDVCTRWNSTYEMLDTTLEFKVAFSELVVRDKMYTYVPSDEDWMKAEHVHQFLKVFYDCTKIFSANKYPTANQFLPEIIFIMHALKKCADEGPDFLQMMALGMQMKFDKYWADCHLLMAIAVVMDPRYKMAMVRYVFRSLYFSSERVSIETTIIYAAVEELFTSYVGTFAATSSTIVTPQSMCSTSIEGTRLRDFMSFLDEEEAKMQKTESELEKYLKEPVIRLQEDDFNVLQWWKSRTHEYPGLSVMARDILSIPISTVTSELAFSTGSRVVSKFRSSLASKTIEALICTQDWLHPVWGGSNFDVDEDEDENGSQDEHASKIV